MACPGDDSFWSSFILGSLLHLGGIPTSLHLWHLPLLLQFLPCILCPVAITPSLWIRTSHCTDGLLWRVRLLLLPSLLPRRRSPVLLPPVSLSLLSPSLLFVLRNHSSFLRSRMSRVIWKCKTKLITTFRLTSTPPVVWMSFLSLTLPMLRPVIIGRVSFKLLSRIQEWGPLLFF